LEQRIRSLEGVEMNWKNRRVLLTGHTGFKGSWLSLWLQAKGAEVCGIALPPPTGKNLFHDARVERGMRSIMGDIRDLEVMTQAISEHRPEIVFHLAAQPLVRSSYVDPLNTYSTNVMGTANVLEAVRKSDSVRAVVVVTTDKCYENREWVWPYREVDRLGGYDPYSNSKACAELVVSAYRNSFFNPSEYARHGVSLASVRAGNVIGGGDWAEDRLIPDTIRAFMDGRVVRIRNPKAVRPWQFVMEPLQGYILTAESLLEKGVVDGEAWNFGPHQSDERPVEWIVQEIANAWGEGAQWELESSPQPHEAQNLGLDWSKAAARLGWRPALRLKEAIVRTVSWYRARLKNEDMYAYTNAQIEEFGDSYRQQQNNPRESEIIG